ncbi:MAG: protein kinase [Holophagales bacterium]|nr:protein kinase [Holophagales bacterium]
MLLKENQMLGKYRIVGDLGAGGFGTVYLAFDELLKRYVALKVPHQQGDVKELEEEPMYQSWLNHVNIVTLYNKEDFDGVHFWVMEFVKGDSVEMKGKSLDRLIREKGCLEPQRALEISIGISSAIEHAHSHQIIHRDLRPANILMTWDGIPKVTDFGTSRILEAGEYAPTRIGSPPYMAPEHFKGRAVFQSDLWSLGITMYEMLTGGVPFYDVDPGKIHQAFMTRDILHPHLRNPKIPKAFSELVMKCLKINLGERVISANELLKNLSALNEPKEQGSAAMQQKPPQIAILPNQLPASHAPKHSSAQDRSCWNCHLPLHKTATICPRCKEKN